MQLAQAEQDKRINALAASIDQTVADGAALTNLVQAQAKSIATMGESVAKLDRNFTTMNTTMALLLEKVTLLTDAKKSKPPRNANILQRPPSPTTSRGKCSQRPDDDANDEEEEITQAPGSQRAKSTQQASGSHIPLQAALLAIVPTAAEATNVTNAPTGTE
jgi:hypothetical protein